MRTELVLVALLAGCLPQGGEQELRTRVPGTWVGTAPDGTQLTMRLQADGTGEVNGHPGTWEIKVGRILLSDGEHLVPCDLSGEELACHTPEGDLVLRRAGPGEVSASKPAEPPPQPVAPAPFVPEKTVPGQPFIAPANGPIGGCSFTLPDGWSWEGADTLRSAEVASATLTFGRLHGSGPQRVMLQSAIDRYTASQHQMLLAPEEIDVGGRPGARAILTHDVSEYYAATVAGKDVIFVIVGRYPAERAEAMRPVVETVLGSFRASP